MPLPPRAERLAFFIYQPPVWSIGDRLRVTFEFESDAELRESLAPLALGWFADEKLLEQRIQVLDAFEVDASVFGNLVTLTLGPEDTYEHLGEADYDRAEALEARFHAAGLFGPRSARQSLEDWTFPPPPRPPAPPSAAGPPRFLVEIKEPTADGWIACVRERLGGQQSGFSEVRITAETHVVDLGADPPTGALALELDLEPDLALEVGQLAITTITMGPGPDGIMCATADHLERIRPGPALVARIGAAFAVLKGAGIVAHPRPPEEIARDYLLRREVFPDFTVEALLDATLGSELLGRAVESYPLLSNHVAWALGALHELKLPCLFPAHRAVDEAVARCQRGEPPELVREELFHSMVAEIHRALERAGDARRFMPMRLSRQPEVLTYLLLTEAQRRTLLDAGLVTAPSAS